MCGIAGGYGRPDSDTVSSMLDTLRHRGPDGRGIFRSPDGTCVLGHTRLAIIDLAGGRQPLPGESGEVWVTFNGEIYNFADLRRESIARGHRFRTASDTEVLVHLYEDLGPEMVRRLDGMFALALWDGKRLFLARDPLGIKPLYYGFAPDGTLYFASELKALRRACAAAREFPPGTWFRSGEGFHRYYAVPGHGTAREAQPGPRPAGFRSPPEAARRLRAVLEAAVAKRLVADVPVGVFLSGGLDSSLVAAIARRLTDGPLHSFAVGTRDSADLAWARRVVDRMTMAWSLEGRVPFLDRELVEVALGALPPSWKLRPRGRRGRPVEKWILRLAAGEDLPDEIVWRKKEKFSHGTGASVLLARLAAEAVGDAEVAKAARRDGGPPVSREEILYRRLYDEFFPGGYGLETVGRTRSLVPGEIPAAAVAGGVDVVRETTLVHPSLWDAAEVGRLARRLLKGSQLIVASNRAPYARGRKRWIRPAGGLAAALDPVLQATGGIWVAAGNPSDGGVVPLPPGKGLYHLRSVPLTAEEIEGYYLGYANGALWPLCHLLVERASFPAAAWQAYRRVNARFAAAIARQARPGDLVWLHDYHLALCPALLRQAVPAVTIALFWHIPWPPHDVFRLCPQRKALLAGLLGADLLGFQTEESVRNFVDCALRELGARLQEEPCRVLYRGRATRIGVFPISIDYATLAGLARAPLTRRRARLIQSALKLSGQAVGVGVDRLDYTKGILQRLQALDIFFTRYPDQRGRVTFVQVAVPNRTGLEAYRTLRRQVEEAVTAINARHALPGWKPIRYVGRFLEHPVLAALYRLADFAVVSSLYDGMNLVAKEFAACQVDRPGILLLSETAGASRELEGAIPINPLDPEGLAEAIRQALAMPVAERRLRVQAWQAHLARHNVFKWAADVLRAAVQAG